MLRRTHTLLLLLLTSLSANAGEAGTVAVPMIAGETGTYYVPVNIAGTVPGEMLLDTGSEFLVINENTYESLQTETQLTYVKDVIGVMADGTDIKVPVYNLSSLSIGCCCVIQDMEVAVFPRNTRQILGLAALRKVAPFAVSLEPASLTMSNCSGTPDSGKQIAGKTDRQHPLNKTNRTMPNHDIASMIIPPQQE